MEFASVVRGGQVVTEDAVGVADIGIVDGKIAAIGEDLPRGEVEVDATEMVVVPGGVDVHAHFGVHIDAVGAAMADDYESGTRAAAAGGITTVLTFAFQQQG